MRRWTAAAGAALLVFIGAVTAQGQARRTSSPPGAQVYFVYPHDGTTVPPKFIVQMGLKSGMGIAPAGIEKANTGHHHLLVDTDLGAPDEPIPADDNHLHFGNGQTEAALALKPGRHTLQLVLGDLDHVPHDPPVMSKKITINVARQ
jgi:uncharacterized protein DUF4399